MISPGADKLFVFQANFGLRNASVLVTGASGFLGGRLIHKLAGRCARVVAMARGTATVAHPGLRNVDLVLGDVTEPHQIQSALDGVDVVIHFAGHSGARASAEDPLFDLRSNVGGMVSLLEAIRKNERPCRVVFPGSRLEYGRVEEIPVREDAPIRPMSPYGIDKYACEVYLDTYSRMYGIGYAVARLTNPYGPWIAPPVRDYNVLNKMIATAEAGGTLTIYGDGAQLRDYIFVDDVVDAILLLAAREDNIVANIGSGEGIPFRTAAETIVRIVGRGQVNSVPWPADAKLLETGDFVADVSRMRSFGWAAHVGFEDGVTKTVRALRAA